MYTYCPLPIGKPCLALQSALPAFQSLCIRQKTGRRQTLLEISAHRKTQVFKKPPNSIGKHTRYITPHGNFSLHDSQCNTKSTCICSKIGNADAENKSVSLSSRWHFQGNHVSTQRIVVRFNEFSSVCGHNLIVIATVTWLT